MALCHNSGPRVSSTVAAQPIPCPDRSFRRSPSAFIGVHRLPSSASKFFLRDPADRWLPKRHRARAAPDARSAPQRWTQPTVNRPNPPCNGTSASGPIPPAAWPIGPACRTPHHGSAAEQGQVNGATDRTPGCSARPRPGRRGLRAVVCRSRRQRRRHRSGGRDAVGGVSDPRRDPPRRRRVARRAGQRRRDRLPGQPGGAARPRRYRRSASSPHRHGAHRVDLAVRPDRTPGGPTRNRPDAVLRQRHRPSADRPGG